MTSARNYSIALVIIVMICLAGASTQLWRQDHHPPVDFSQIPAGKERKTAFFDYFAPIIRAENNKVLALRKKVLDARKRRNRDRWAARLADEYKLPGFDPGQPQSWDALLRRIDVIPTSLALAQGAAESAWGTSRFAREGNNFFGHWCYVPGCGLVPEQRSSGARHEVAVFDSPRHAVERYIFNLNTQDAYRKLRTMRGQLRQNRQQPTGLRLSEGLARYSERGQLYVRDIQHLIRHNRLERFDELATIKN